MNKVIRPFIFLVSLLMGGVIILTPMNVRAGSCQCTDGTSFSTDDNAACLNYANNNLTSCTFSLSGSTGGDGLSGSTGGGPVDLPNPLGQSDPRIIIGNIIKVVLGIVGSLALIIFIYGGLMWMTSSGNTERIKKGRDTLVWATIGLMVIFGSYTVVNFVIQSLTKS